MRKCRQETGSVWLRWRSTETYRHRNHGPSGDKVAVPESLRIDNDNGEDLVELETVEVSGETEIATGDDDDLITILDSIFAGEVEVDGGDDDDTLVDGGGNTFGGGLDLDDIETVLP